MLWKQIMMRGIQHICFTKGAFLEPYVTAIPISSHFSSKSNCSSKHKNPHNLPRLPVPKLEDTLCKYLKSVKPHLNDEELAVTTKLISDFTECDAGEKLQCILQKRAEETDNWLEDWWLNTAYLEYRDPVVVYSSPGLVFPFRRFKNQQEQIEFTAKTIVAAMEYKTLIDCDKIPLEKMGKHPLDMAQYKKIFGTCRVPGEKRDRLSYNSDSKHITVIHNNHIFHLDLWGDDDTMLSELQIANRLNKIIECSSTRNEQPVGILTSENRNAWAKAYNALSKNSKNRENLCDIEQSLAVVCLDQASGLWDTTKSRRSLAAGQCIHGGGSGCNGGNRWFDKTIQFIFGADGVTGLTYEHSPAEGQPIAVLTDFIINFIDQCKTSSTCSMSPKDPKRLDFDVDCDVSTMIEKAQNNLDRLVCDLEINCFKYDKYGKGFIKSQKLSPDSYLQMAMQYAFYRLHKTPAAHYESAATRMFLGGRTETIRSCSVESVAFAKTMLDKNCSSKEKANAMKKAITAHKDYTVQALQGLGVDRHLLGLKLAAIENGIDLPKLYLDVSFKRSTHMRLSTSQVACKCDGYMAYGPLVPDGYSTCYNPREEDINFATSAFCSNKETSCEKYRDALENSLKDMHDVLVKTVCSKL